MKPAIGICELFKFEVLTLSQHSKRNDQVIRQYPLACPCQGPKIQPESGHQKRLFKKICKPTLFDYLKTYDVWLLRVPVFAHSAVGCMEGQNFNATGVLTALSSQQIVECSTPGKNFHLVDL